MDNINANIFKYILIDISKSINPVNICASDTIKAVYMIRMFCK